MIEQIESTFVNTYIQKQYRERFLFELCDNSRKMQRRYRKAFKKFSHSAEDYLISRLIVVSSNKLTEQDILSFIQKFITEKTCYYMDEKNGEEMSINEAIEKSFNNLGVSIIVYKNIFSIIKEETFVGAPKKIILINQ